MKKLLTFVIYLFPFFILSQEIDLNGNIIEKETGSPMSGATIQIVGSDIEKQPILMEIFQLQSK